MMNPKGVWETLNLVFTRVISSNIFFFLSGAYISCSEDIDKYHILVYQDHFTLKKDIKWNESDKENLISVIFSRIIKIDSYQFEKYLSLTSVYIPSSVKYIEENSFAECVKLTSVIFTGPEEGLRIIDDNAFWLCTSLSEIVFPSSLKIIGENAFSNCDSLTSMNIPPSPPSPDEKGEKGEMEREKRWEMEREKKWERRVKTVGDGAFYKCINLVSVRLSEQESIESHTFSYCYKLADVKIPASVKRIGEYAFQTCISLTEIILPPYLKTIEEDAFRECTSLTEIILPSSLKRIKDGAFYGCINLTSVKFSGQESNLTVIEKHTFGNCHKLVDIKIPSSVTCIGENAFFDCKSLTEIDIHIPSRSVGINRGVRSIKHDAFFDCSSLKKINFISSINSLGEMSGEVTDISPSELADEEKIIIEYDSFHRCDKLDRSNFIPYTMFNPIWWQR